MGRKGWQQTCNPFSPFTAQETEEQSGNMIKS